MLENVSLFFLHLPPLVMTWVAVELVEKHDREWVQHTDSMHKDGVCHIYTFEKHWRGFWKPFHPQNQIQWIRYLGHGNPRFEADLFFRVDSKVKYLIRWYTQKHHLLPHTIFHFHTPSQIWCLIHCGNTCWVDASQGGCSCRQCTVDRDRRSRQ